MPSLKARRNFLISEFCALVILRKLGAPYSLGYRETLFRYFT